MYLFNNFYIFTPKESGEFKFFKGSVLVENGKIKRIFKEKSEIDLTLFSKAEIIEGYFKKILMPGFIQTHIHLCQTSHRNLAEDMPLIDWLKKEIWPYEASLTRRTMGKTVVLALKEIIAGGTTAVLDMGTVAHQKVVFEIMEIVGFRYTGGKAMMDQVDDAPQPLRESTAKSIQESWDLKEEFHKKNNGLIHYAFAPRFLLSCSDSLLQEVKKLSDEYEILIHTHGAEHKEEIEYIKSQTGMGNIEYLHHIGALNKYSVIAHMVHLDKVEKQIVKETNLSVVHCPTANLKLGSGVAPISKYLDENIVVGIGADGAPCNNSLSMFFEMKLASLLQKGVNHKPELMNANNVLKMATLNGAKILNQEHKIGKIEQNFDADLIVLDMDTPQTLNYESNPGAAIVYGADARNVESTMVRGKFLYRNGEFSKEIQDIEKFFNDETSF